MRLIDAFKAFWAVLTGSDLVAEAELAPLKAQLAGLEKELGELKEAPARDQFREGAIYALVLLQREGRLVDFLNESIDAYSDDQIGAAVRSIHSGSAKVLSENFDLKAIRDEAENTSVEIPEGFDPQEVKLTGSVPSQAPFKGTLAHKGWRVGTTSFPERSDSINPDIIQPAEVTF